jgi:protein LSM14
LKNNGYKFNIKLIPVKMNNEKVNQLIGDRFTVITKKKVRYEGTLKNLDLKSGFIILEDVKVYGTEDRETDHPVSASELILPVNSFHSSDIESINRIEIVCCTICLIFIFFFF